MSAVGHLLLGAGCPQSCRTVLLPCCPHTFPSPFWKSCQARGCGSKERAGSCSHHHSPAPASQTFSLEWHYSHYIAPLQNAFLHKYLPKSTGWLRTFTGCFLFSSLFPQGMLSSGLGQLHTLLSPSAQSPVAVVGNTGFTSWKGLPASDLCCAIALGLNFSQLGH